MKSIYIIAGKDELLVNAECQKLLGELLEPQQRAAGLFDADPSQVSISEVLDELRTAPFLADKRVVVVKKADKFVSENRPLLENYFDNPCPTGVLILTLSSWPEKTKLAKKLNKVGKLIKVTQPSRGQMPRRLQQYAREAHDKNLTKEAAEVLIELAGDEMVQLYGEIDKLAVFADAEKTITIEHVESLIGHNRIFNAFAVIDAVVAGDITKAVNRLRNMFAEDKSAEYSAVGAFAYHFRRMFNAKVLLEKGVRSSEIASQLRIWGDRNGFFAQVRKMSLKQIGSILQKLAYIDYAVKTGQTKVPVAMEQLVLELAAS